MLRLIAAAVALCLFTACGDDGSGDGGGDCAVECLGCVPTAEFTVMLPGATDGTVVTAGSLSCTPVALEVSTCRGPYPGEDGTTIDVSAPGFEMGSVTLTLMRDPDPPTECCGCPDDILMGSVALTPAMDGGMMDGGGDASMGDGAMMDGGTTDGGGDAASGDAGAGDAGAGDAATDA